MNIKGVALLVALVILVGGGWYLVERQAQPTASPDGEARELVIYSGRKEPLILPIIQEFENQTGISVTVKPGSTEELANLIMEEGAESAADVYIGTDASLMQMLASQGLLAPITTSRLQEIPEEYRSRENEWTGVSGRSRVLIVNTDMVEESEYPESVTDITQETWKGKVAMAKMSNESVVTHLSALRILNADAFVSEFLQGLQENEVTFLPGHTDVRQAVGRGEFPIGLVNHYYGHLQQEETDNIAIIYPDQQEGQDGAFVNVSAVGILASSKSQQEAQEFVAFLLSPETQQLFAELNFEYPLHPSVTTENTRKLSEFTHMDVTLDEVSQDRQGTLDLIRREGL